MLGNKASLANVRKLKPLNIFSDHNSMRLEISYKKTAKPTNMQRQNYTLPYKQWLAKEIKEETNNINENKQKAQ